MTSRLSTLSTPRFGVQNGIAAMREEMDQLFDHLFNRSGDHQPATGTWYAPIALWEDGEHVWLEIELPGVSKDDIELTVERGQLRIAAGRKAPQDHRRCWYSERRYGRFERVVSLPDAVDADSIEAELRDGVLSMKLAKRPEAQPRRISVITPH